MGQINKDEIRKPFDVHLQKLKERDEEELLNVILQQAAEIERLKSVEHTLCLTIGSADKAIQQSEEARKAAERERDEEREVARHHERQAHENYLEVIRQKEHNAALRECLATCKDAIQKNLAYAMRKDEQVLLAAFNAIERLAELDRKDTLPEGESSDE